MQCFRHLQQVLACSHSLETKSQRTKTTSGTFQAMRGQRLIRWKKKKRGEDLTEEAILLKEDIFKKRLSPMPDSNNLETRTIKYILYSWKEEKAYRRNRL